MNSLDTENLLSQNEDELIKIVSGKILAGYVIVYQKLGIHKELSIKCMKELLIRRNNGDNFNFEEYIETEIKNFPEDKKIDATNLSNFVKTYDNRK